jgi:enamine deaminase RidA (YjgF/YER057c/UK114 family)
VIEAVRPDGWAAPVGYSDAVAARGRMVFVAGQVGWDPATQTFASDDFAAQARQALENVAATLRAAGAAPEHLVRLTWFVTSKAEYRAARRELGRAYRDVIGPHYPAMSLLVVSALLEDRAKVEIEATAVVPE